MKAGRRGADLRAGEIRYSRQGRLRHASVRASQPHLRPEKQEAPGPALGVAIPGLRYYVILVVFPSGSEPCGAQNVKVLVRLQLMPS